MNCSKCQRDRPKEEFRTGRRWCRDCRRLYGKMYYQFNKEKCSNRAKAYYPTHKKRILTAANTYYANNKNSVLVKRKAYRLANIERCKDSGRAYRQANKGSIKKYRNENKERKKKYMKKYCKANAEKYRGYARKRKALRLRSVHEPYSDNYIYERDGWVCGLCGKIINKDLKWPNLLSKTIDHIVPLSRGGSDTSINAQAAHLKCNLIKHNKNNCQLRLLA